MNQFCDFLFSCSSMDSDDENIYIDYDALDLFIQLMSGTKDLTNLKLTNFSKFINDIFPNREDLANHIENAKLYVSSIEALYSTGSVSRRTSRDSFNGIIGVIHNEFPEAKKSKGDFLDMIKLSSMSKAYNDI